LEATPKALASAVLAASFLSPAASVWIRTLLPPMTVAKHVAADSGLGDGCLGLLLVAARVSHAGEPELGPAAELDPEVEPSSEDPDERQHDEDAGEGVPRASAGR
jgi:hypothetical protein